MQIQYGPPRIYSSVMRGQSNRKVATAAVLLGLVISAFEGTVVTTAMPTITSALGGARLYAWVFTAFLLASTLGVMLVGKLGDHVGRKPAFLGGIALFLVGSSLCGLASRPDRLPRRAGPGRRRHPAHHHDHRRRPLHLEGARGGAERLHRRVGARQRARAGHRRMDRRPRLLALGLPRQRAGERGGGRAARRQLSRSGTKARPRRTVGAAARRRIGGAPPARARAGDGAAHSLRGGGAPPRRNRSCRSGTCATAPYRPVSSEARWPARCSTPPPPTCRSG